MVSRARIAGFAILLMVTALCAAQDGPRWLDVEFPRDSPVLPVSISLGPTTTIHPRGSSMAFDLHASLLLRNTGLKQISGLTLRVEAQDITPSGKGSVTVPSLDVRPGEVFPVRIDMQLVRPFSVSKGDGALVRVSLDCALYADLSSYGPDRLGSRRALMVYELEARRDRHYLLALLQSGKLSELREELNFGLEDITPQQLGLELLRDPRRLLGHEQPVAVGAVAFASAPVQPLGGEARVAGNEVHAPQVEVRNRSQSAVRTVDLGWIVRDERGRDFVAGSVPTPVRLGPVETGTMTESGTLRFNHPTGRAMNIGALLAFVSNVEFADGKLWIPTRSDIEAATKDPSLRRSLATSPEQQRLAGIYRRKGISGLSAELRKVN